MPKKVPNSPVTSATHRLTLEMAGAPEDVWKYFTEDIDSWWPLDFRAAPSPQRMVLEVKLGGRLYEDAGDGNGLVWYHVIALDAPRSIVLSGFVAPPFGGPATSLLRIVFSARSETATVMEMCDSMFGCLGDTAATAQGWRTLFAQGFKSSFEAKR